MTQVKKMTSAMPGQPQRRLSRFRRRENVAVVAQIFVQPIK
jgi:hypothetical protein